jgi:glyoxylase-like metal-dependent hydrolase (beta-lactamase superfamily II)
VLRVTRVLAPNPSVYTLEGTNTWVVGEGPAVVIDPGPDDQQHLREVAAAAADRGGVGAVLVTHDHPDHAPGAPSFAGMVRAPLFAFRLAGAEHLRDGQQIRMGSTGDGAPLELVAVHTPGHTSDHVAFHVASSAALFTGDAVLGRGTSFIDPPDGDLTQYLRSLTRMLDLAPATIYPGHGPVVLGAQTKLREYLDHRADREAQVLTAMDDGHATVSDMVASIYVDYPPEVHALAGRSVLAHLLKLEKEGRASKNGRGDAATWSATVPRTCERCGKPVGGRARYCGSCSLVMLQEGDAAAAGPPEP